MEAHEIYEVVEDAWPFTPEKYPPLQGLKPNQAKIFILTHILKHQSGTLAYCWEAITKSGSAKSEKTRNCVHKLLFNSIRFAIVLRVKEETLVAVLDAWNKPRETGLPIDTYEGSVRVFGKESIAGDLRDFVEEYIDLILRSAELLEPPDHGGRLLTAQLKLNATRSMNLGAQLARRYYFTQSDFEGWLSEDHSL
jgi:hypothetical protein